MEPTLKCSSISKQSTIEGNISCDHMLKVFGAINGNVNAKKLYLKNAVVHGDLYVEEDLVVINSKIYGTITASSIAFSGTCRGDILASKLEFFEEVAHVYGDVQADTLLIKPRTQLVIDGTYTITGNVNAFDWEKQSMVKEPITPEISPTIPRSQIGFAPLRANDTYLSNPGVEARTMDEHQEETIEEMISTPETEVFTEFEPIVLPEDDIAFEPLIPFQTETMTEEEPPVHTEETIEFEPSSEPMESFIQPLEEVNLTPEGEVEPDFEPLVETEPVHDDEIESVDDDEIESAVDGAVETEDVVDEAVEAEVDDTEEVVTQTQPTDTQINPTPQTTVNLNGDKRYWKSFLKKKG